MAEEFRPAKHGGQLRDGFFFHGRRGAPAIERVIVGIDGHRQGIRKLSDGVRGLQHLAGIQGMKIGVIVLQTFRGCREYVTDAARTLDSAFLNSGRF